MIRGQRSGFTLIELMVGVSVLAILAATGAAIFLRTLRSSSAVEIRKTLDSRAGLILDGLGRFLREGSVVSLSGSDRQACLAAGSVSGDSLTVHSLDGFDTVFSVSSGLLSSVSAQTVVLNPESVTLQHKAGLGYYFIWYCMVGVSDRLFMEFNAVSIGQEGDTSVNNDYVLDVVMRNSGQ